MPLSEPDLLLEEDFLPNSQQLFASLTTEIPWDERMKSRKTATFGEAYNYSGITYEPVPMHPLLISTIDRLEARLTFRPNNCLLNFYESGEATMGFHSDSIAELATGTGVAIVSLGDERRITFQHKRNKKEVFEYRLAGGSLLYMPAHIQQDWRHAILKQTEAGSRISLTFRQIAQQVAI